MFVASVAEVAAAAAEVRAVAPGGPVAQGAARVAQAEAPVAQGAARVAQAEVPVAPAGVADVHP